MEKMKTLLQNWMLMAAAVLSLGMTFVACSDDDDDSDSPKSEEQKAEEQQAKLSKFWDVVGQLISSDDYTADYANATFEPTYGIASEANPTVRIVNTNDMATAAARFAALVGVSSIDENTSSYEWKDPDVGTLSYRKTNDGTSLAEVDVDIRQLPSLQRIVYQLPGSGTNGTFNGNAYYRFGDVVQRVYKDKKDNNTEKTEYWICVRPAFGPAGKEDSHWVSISEPPKANIYEWKSDAGVQFALPTGIGKSEEHMQNFAELLFAIAYPDIWGQNLTEELEKPKMWYDFKLERYPYHNKYFFKRVAEGWKKDGDKGVIGKVLNLEQTSGRTPIERLRYMLYRQGEVEDASDPSGLHLLCKGYSWPWGWTCTLYGYKFTNGTGKEANMHKMTPITYKKDVSGLTNNTKLDITSSNHNGKACYLQHRTYFDDGARHYVIRHATGKDIAGHKIGVYDALGDGSNGVTDFYNYNKMYNVPVGAGTQIENSLTADDVEVDDSANPYYMLGDVLSDSEGSYWICFRGSGRPFSPSNNKALFMSFDGIKTNGRVATNVPQDNEKLIEYAWYLTYFLKQNMPGSRTNAACNDTIVSRMKRHANFDCFQAIAQRDSIYGIIDKLGNPVKDKNGQIMSKSTSVCFMLAYNDGNTEKQPLLRCIYDQTHGGNQRSADPISQDMFTRLYKHYQKRPTTLTQTVWQSQWDIDETAKIYLQDVASQEEVNAHAFDKWAVLPLHNQTQRNQMRTQADDRANNPKNYFWVNRQPANNALSMYNEPVLFLRIMALEDKGHAVTKTPEGLPLTEVYHATYQELFKTNQHNDWMIYPTQERLNGTYVDNVLTVLPTYLP